MGGTATRLRLVQASENLGIDMQMAYKHVSRHESDNGEAHFLFGVAVAQEDDYQKLVNEVDRLAAESHADLTEDLASDNADARVLERYLVDAYERQIAAETHQSEVRDGLSREQVIDWGLE